MKKIILLSVVCCTAIMQCSLYAFSLASPALGIDLGTRNSIMVINENDRVIKLVEEVSAVCYDRKTGKLICIGQEAIDKIGKCPQDRNAMRIIQDGNIAHKSATKAFLQELLRMATYHVSIFVKPLVVVGVPGVVSPGDASIIRDALAELGFGAHKIKVVREPVAAAIGEGLAIENNSAWPVIDIGGGTTDIVVIGQKGILARSERPCTLAGDAMDKAIVNYIFDTFKLEISPETAEEIKREIGCVHLEDNNAQKSISVYGKDPVDKLPKEITLTSEDVAKALEVIIQGILKEAHDVLASVEDRAAGDIKRNGILLVGGGALLPGLKTRIEQAFKIKVIVPADPLHSVANGIGKILAKPDYYDSLLHNPGDAF